MPLLPPFVFDGLGSTVALTDSTGAVKNTYAYDPYGNVTASTGSVANPYRFGGAYGAYTDSSGLLKIGQRYYDPSIERWTQQDLLAGALTSPMMLNRYAYVNCNPVNGIDPSGSDSDANCYAAVVGFGYSALGVVGSIVATPAVPWLGIPLGTGSAIGLGLAIYTMEESCRQQ